MSVEHFHGQHVIRTMMIGSIVKARAFAGSRVIANADGKSLAEALLAIRSELDRRDLAERAKRHQGIPTHREFMDAFSALKDRKGKATETHFKMLMALLNAPERTLTAMEIAAAAGYDSYTVANSRLGIFAHEVCDYFNYEPPRRRHGDQKPMWTTILATEAAPQMQADDENWRWTMRPEVARALQEMDL